ncbi:hypothetical protein MKX03_017378 [Papaver bracteatum]|nr:hypothetical protein MKX03_017378 [Papaver bracteatum]
MGSEGAILFDLNILPEGCISTVLSLTSSIDACKSSVVSSTFRMASDSDVIFSLDKSTGKIQYLLGARELSIADGNNPLCWSWKLAPESRFSEVTVLRSITNLKICGKIQTSMLSPETTYAAYLILKFEEWAYGLDSIPSELLIRENDGNSSNKGFAYLSRDNDKKKQQMKQLFFANRMQLMRSKVIMEEDQGKEMRVFRDRNDGWMEIELGEFYLGKCGKNDHNKEVKMSLMEVKGGQLKGGLIVQGIEVRPKLR